MRIFQWNNSAVVFAHGDNMWQPTKCERRLEWSSTSLLPTTCHNHHSGFCRLMIRIGTILGTYWNQHCYRITNFLQFCYLQPQHRSISRPFFLVCFFRMSWKTPGTNARARYCILQTECPPTWHLPLDVFGGANMWLSWKYPQLEQSPAGEATKTLMVVLITG